MIEERPAMSIEIVHKVGQWAPEGSREYDESRAKIVVLTTGYEIDCADPRVLEHILTAVFMETFTRVAPMSKVLEDPWSTIEEQCIREIFYVAGQLRENQVLRIDHKLLCEQFASRWRRFHDDSSGSDATN
jgi:hypothetical protein